MNVLGWTESILLAAIVVIGNVCPAAASQDLGEVPFAGKAEFLRALRIGDQEERFREVNDFLDEFLVRGDQQTRYLTTHYVAKYSRWFDFRPYEAVFLEAEATNGDSTALYVLDLQDLEFGPRAELIEALGQALEKGKVVLRRGDILTRESAIRWVGREGIEELKESVVRIYPSVHESFERQYPRGRFLIEFELAEGASGTEDAYKKSAARLLSMERAELLDELETNRFFGELIVSLAQNACAVNPIDFSRNTACEDFVTLWSRESERGNQSGVKRNEQPIWLQSLGHATESARCSEVKVQP